DVLDLRGRAGHFSAYLHHHPRYIDLAKCVACGDCVKVCPVVVPDRFNYALSQRRAVYKLYPQAIPNAYTIEKKGIAPCRDACPAGQRAQGYIALIREGRWQDALRVIKMDNPFPGICGRICNHRCETACNRGLVDEPINIRALKRFVTDQVYAGDRQPVAPARRLFDQKIAVIGAGPCGLTAAQDLALAGFGVTVFEAMPVAGGMLRLGVPEHRLPTEIVEREVQDIIDLGVDLRLNTRVNNLDEIFGMGFAAVLIAVGAHEGIRLPIPGADLQGVIINTHFLRDVRLGRYQRGSDSKLLVNDAPPLEGQVLVLGGGNVAIDCARIAVRLGLQVDVACLESREQMPAHSWEVAAAEAEGVIIHSGVTFERLVGDADDHVRGIECSRAASFSFDEKGRLNVEKVPNSLHRIPCDTVIFSVGQRAGLAFIPADANVGLTDRQTIAINPNTLATSRAGVFAAGDCISGTAFVIEAVARGHTAAESIIRYLRSESLERPTRPELPVVHLSQQDIDDRIARGEIHRQPRVPIPELSVEERVTSFAEVERGYDNAQAQAEAERCLACGVCSECMSCVFACGIQAIDHDMLGSEEVIDIGAVILAPGYQVYQAELSEAYGFGRFPNVLTAPQYERVMSASGPTFGHIQRPSDHDKPQRIAFLQCIGSRDQSHDYCSAVCCMYATKEAIMSKEHHPELDVHVFMMDMRAFSKGYLSYFERARERYGVHYHRCRISGLFEDPETHDLLLDYLDEDGCIHQERFNLVVLSVGMEISESVRELGRRLGIELDDYGFCSTVQFNPVESSRSGIYAVGPFREPKDIPESIVEASSAAGAVAERLSSARFTLTTRIEYPIEKDIADEPPYVGVFVCHCGSNIAGYIDVQAVTEYAASLRHVVHAESNLYTCSQDSIRHITEQVQTLGLNRVVVASCTPRTHEPLFRDSLRAAGLNPYLFEMANIRNQCSWVHSNDREAATQKAIDLVRMAVARAVLLEPRHTIQVAVERSALVVGGGAAGMTAALSLAAQGFPVHLVEKEAELGGNLRWIFTTSNGKHPQVVLEQLVGQVSQAQNITVYLNSQVTTTRGFKGNFSSLIQSADGESWEISHGAVILATGAQEYRGPEYGYGSHPHIITQQQFEALLTDPHSPVNQSKQVLMIQCVGPGEHTCGRICCTVALKNALVLKEKSPHTDVIILYRDIRTYGFKERLYTQAREKGIIFIRYEESHRPEIVNGLIVHVYDPILKRRFELHPDWIVLSSPAVPGENAQRLAALFKVPVDSDGFFMEAHVKLKPVDFATEGVFMAGMAHYPKLLDESMIQARAAAARAARLLSQESLVAGGSVAEVDPTRCTGCLTCVRICPFHVPAIRMDQMGVGNIMGAAYIEPSICQGCGTCVSECPARAIQLMHYTDKQMMAKVGALTSRDDWSFIPLEEVRAG
ncbi:MAG: FAD-dependent oxidoreductase, partial [Chloroflexi bacterium]|nr:FAD-dependent oxidoreductase [Chloroflexota bacterium]